MTDPDLTSTRSDVERVVLEYSHIVDAREWTRLGELFDDDGSFVVAGTAVAVHGLPAVREFMETFAGHPVAHLTTNVVVDVLPGGTRATARSLAFGPRADGTAIVGRYTDDLVLTEGGWRLALRHVDILVRGWPSNAGL